MNDMQAYVYVKYEGMNSFKAFDLENRVSVDRLIYASILDVTEENKAKLQRLADINKEIGLQIQLRVGNKIYFKTI